MRVLLVVAFTLLIHGSAQAWTRPGHMVTAAIAYDELSRRNPAALKRLVELAAQHPDRGPFEVAVGRETGEARSRRLFLELARWPDDVRGGPFDHPTWHYALAPVADPQDARPRALPGDTGAAFEAFALNARVASDPKASPAERAVALCWVLHLAGDIHQPLHTAQLFSERYPQGDRGGSLEHVRDTQTGLPITLHWFWDDSVHRDSDWDAAVRRAEELTTRLPRRAFPELADGRASAAGFPAWARESRALAGPLVYRGDLATGASAAGATPLAPRYAADATAAAERRLTLAGYRLADIAEALVASD